MDYVGILAKDSCVSPVKQLEILKLVDKCGSTAVDMRDNVKVEAKTGPEDLVTCADNTLSELILSRLAELFPDCDLRSEEGNWDPSAAGRRWWLIDPIDGTKEYVKRTGLWSVMMGLIDDDAPVFGCIHIPDRKITYFGGQTGGAWRWNAGETPRAVEASPTLDRSQPIRLLVSKNDLAANLWVKDIPGIELQVASSIGLDLSEVIEGRSDVFVHIRPTLKVWDTAAPSAVALGCGLEVGTEHGPSISFAGSDPAHKPCMVIGRKGAVDWWRSVFATRTQS